MIVTATLCADAAATIDQVVADARPGDRPEARSDREEFGRHPLAAGKHGVDLGKVGTKLGGRQREIADRVDQLEAGVGQDLAKSARLVAKQVGTNQNSGHGQLGEIVVIIAGKATADGGAAVDSRAIRPPPEACVGQRSNLFSSDAFSNREMPERAVDTIRRIASYRCRPGMM